MSGMDDRAKQFKVAAVAQPTGPALKKEVDTLRRFLFRNQEYRFTKAAQQALYMAVVAHHGNPAAHNASGCAGAMTTTASLALSAEKNAAAVSAATASSSNQHHHEDDEESRDEESGAEAPILRLLDDALKMPFTVFTSAQKDKLLQLYWNVLGTNGGGTATTTAIATHALSLMDLVSVGKHKAQLTLLTEEGEEYVPEVLVTDAAVSKQLKAAFEEGSAVEVTVEEIDGTARFVSFAVEEE